MTKSTVRSVLIALVVCLASPLQSVSAQTQGQKIAGTYWVEIYRDGFGFAAPGLLTLTADGRIVGDQQTGPFQSSVFGNWKKVGDRGAVGKFLGFLYEPSGDPNSILEVSFAGEFDQSGDNGELAFGISFYLPDQNPLDEDPAFGPFPGTLYFSRIPID